MLASLAPWELRSPGRQGFTCNRMPNAIFVSFDSPAVGSEMEPCESNLPIARADGATRPELAQAPSDLNLPRRVRHRCSARRNGSGCDRRNSCRRSSRSLSWTDAALAEGRINQEEASLPVKMRITKISRATFCAAAVDKSPRIAVAWESGQAGIHRLIPSVQSASDMPPRFPRQES